ncbi:MAG TPA: DDE-type integrase/transposase/recombinase [Blastocatellia bacterium]|nr:DDE-type integrase/transposase/recombinase [Blastocatellia bacterium]
MGLTMGERQSLVREIASRYQRASKKDKRRILDEFVQTTGYHRTYASYLLSHHGKRVVVSRKTAIVGDIRKRIRKKREPVYGAEVVEALKRIWGILDLICGKRLKTALPEVIPKLERWGELKLNAEVREKLLRMSASTMDRVLSSERKRMELKSRSGTKPGTLLKHQVPIRTFCEWDESKPGFMEVDLVSHGGGDERGDFCQTLSATDVNSAWTETEAVRNKAQVHVFEGLTKIRARLPFALLGLDSDNGSEFINSHLVAFCEHEQISFTRSRPYRKNDNCYVEQKNYTVVRKTVGYMRHDTDKELHILNRLYSYLRLYTNYFLPSMKLSEKTRIGSKVVKRYQQPKTPYQRLLESPSVDRSVKRRLRAEYEQLNPAQLKREIMWLQEMLLKAVRNKQKKRRAA